MRILINEKRIINNKVIVSGTTDIGSIKGVWKSIFALKQSIKNTGKSLSNII